VERGPRNAAELRQASDHLYYEIWMLMSLARIMLTGEYEKAPISNALLESFTIHTRALLDFFYSVNPWEDDVIAEDFFRDPIEWLDLRPEMTNELMKVNRRVGKEVAHLTYARQNITPEEKQWYFMQIANDMSIVILEFLKHLPRDLLGPRWNAGIQLIDWSHSQELQDRKG
jgi:hypothetical protein